MDAKTEAQKREQFADLLADHEYNVRDYETSSGPASIGSRKDMEESRAKLIAAYQSAAEQMKPLVEERDNLRKQLDDLMDTLAPMPPGDNSQLICLLSHAARHLSAIQEEGLFIVAAQDSHALINQALTIITQQEQK